MIGWLVSNASDDPKLHTLLARQHLRLRALSSRIREVLGIARGFGKVRFGGKHGRALTLKAGDVAILPAGTGHQCLDASDGFLVVGTYPPTGTYDECAGSEDHARALKTIPEVAKPARIQSTAQTGHF